MQGTFALTRVILETGKDLLTLSEGNLCFVISEGLCICILASHSRIGLVDKWSKVEHINIIKAVCPDLEVLTAPLPSQEFG